MSNVHKSLTPTPPRYTMASWLRDVDKAGLQSSMWWPPKLLQQGHDYECVAFAAHSALTMEPKPMKNAPNPGWIYEQARRLEPRQGEGTSLKAVGDVLKKSGYIKNHFHGGKGDIDMVAVSLILKGPVLVAMPVYHGHQNPVGGRLRNTGGILSDHCWVCFGLEFEDGEDYTRGDFWLQSSGGSLFGINGRACISFSEMGEALQACMVFDK